MATDGIKIIDGDLANDIYGVFMEMYDTGASLEAIEQAIAIPFDEEDGFDYEIYITVYALALWQTGQLTSEVLEEVDRVIARGACVEVWTEECGPKEGRRRQHELEKFRSKISQPTLRIRQRKQSTPLQKLIFAEGDVLTFQLMPDDIYCVVILLLVSKRGRYPSYYFIVHDYIGQRKPTMADVLQGKVMGRPAIAGDVSTRKCFDAIGIDHKHLSAIADQFEQIGELAIHEQAKRLGAQAGAISFSDIALPFRYLERDLKSFGSDSRAYSIKNLIR